MTEEIYIKSNFDGRMLENWLDYTALITIIDWGAILPNWLFCFRQSNFRTPVSVPDDAGVPKMASARRQSLRKSHQFWNIPEHKPLVNFSKGQVLLSFGDFWSSNWAKNRAKKMSPKIWSRKLSIRRDYIEAIGQIVYL